MFDPGARQGLAGAIGKRGGRRGLHRFGGATSAVALCGALPERQQLPLSYVSRRLLERLCHGPPAWRAAQQRHRPCSTTSVFASREHRIRSGFKRITIVGASCATAAQPTRNHPRRSTHEDHQISARARRDRVHAASAAAQTPSGALAIDERQGDQYGWAVDYETARAAGQRALSECGSGCSVVLTFEVLRGLRGGTRRRASTAFGVGGVARLVRSRPGNGLCRSAARVAVRVARFGCGAATALWSRKGWGLDRAARREVQEGLQAAGFDPGGADGMFGPRRGRRSGAGRRPGVHVGRGIWTARRWRRRVRRWRVSRRSGSGSRREPPPRRLQPRLRRPRCPRRSSSQHRRPRRSRRTCSGSRLRTARTRRSSKRICVDSRMGCSVSWRRFGLMRCAPGTNAPPASGGRPVGGVNSPASGSRASGAGVASFGGAAGADAPRQSW